MADETPQRPLIIQVFTNPDIQRWIERLIMLAIASYFGVKLNSVHESVESAKDVVTNTNQTQKAIVSGTKTLVEQQVGADAPAVHELKVAQQQAK